jgi:hypothetical protein
MQVLLASAAAAAGSCWGGGRFLIPRGCACRRSCRLGGCVVGAGLASRCCVQLLLVQLQHLQQAGWLGAGLLPSKECSGAVWALCSFPGADGPAVSPV